MPSIYTEQKITTKNTKLCIKPRQNKDQLYCKILNKLKARLINNACMLFYTDADEVLPSPKNKTLQFDHGLRGWICPCTPTTINT